MTDTAQDMLIKSALVEIEQLKARLREVEAERDDAGFRLRLYEVAYEDAVTAIRKLSEDMTTAHTAPVVEPTPEELAIAEAENAKCEAELRVGSDEHENLVAEVESYQGPSSFDYWYDHANGRYQRY